jgi:hypothetical protein
MKSKRVYHRYYGLVELAAQISGRSSSAVYAVLKGRMKSAPVARAIQLAKARIRQLASENADGCDSRMRAGVMDSAIGSSLVGASGVAGLGGDWESAGKEG